MTFLSPIADNVHLVLEYIDRYETRIEEVKPFFTLEGRKLVEVCRNIPKKLAEFKIYAAELKSIEELLSIRRDKIEGVRHKAYNEGYSRQLSQTDIKQYIKGDPEFVEMSELILEITHLRNSINGIIDALDTMNWQMGHITKMAVASLEEYVL
jgi:hypothetical protein